MRKPKLMAKLMPGSMAGSIVGLVVAATLFSGCSALQKSQDAYAQTYLPQVGQTLTLKVALPFPQGRARVFLQQQIRSLETMDHSGDIKLASGWGLSGYGINEYEPYCELESRTLSDGTYQLMPDEFTITRVEQMISHINIVQRPQPLVLAQADEDSSYSQMTYITEMWLSSVAQPEIEKMSCRQVMDPGDGRFVTLVEMQAAVAGILKFAPLEQDD